MRKHSFAPALRVEGLTKRYGAHVALQGLSLVAAPGEVVSFLGRNGAGKTTAFLCMAGLLRPDEGRVFLDGRLTEAERVRSLALIPEVPEVYESLTVWEHLVFTALSCKLGDGWEERAGELLERFELAPHSNVLGASLSKGMRQKTLIVATLLADAPVLLIDEPMIGLDPSAQRELRELIGEMSANGKTILISTHMLATAQSVSDRFIVLHEGRCVYDGSADAFPNSGGEDLESAFLRVTA